MKNFIFTKGKCIVLLVIVVLISTIIMPMTVGAVYSDLDPDYWCFDKIIDFTEKGYISGYSDGTFRPENTVTRAEFVKIVNCFFDYYGSDSDVTFTDVGPNDWFEPYVKEAVARGYIKGYSDGTFRPYNFITRQDAIVILARILGIEDDEYNRDNKKGLIQYKDRDLVEDWAYKAVQSYVVHGFTKGNDEDVIRVLEYLTRAETVGFLNTVEENSVIKRSGGSSKRLDTPVISVYGERDCTEIEIPVEQEWVGYDDATGNFENDILVGNKLTSEIELQELSELEENTNDSLKTKEFFNEQLGAYVSITSSEDLVSIYNTIDGSEPELYSDRLFLTDGVYDVTGYATKSGYRQSESAIRTVKIDTKAPVAEGEQVGELKVAHEQKVNIQVYDTENNGEESKIDTSKLLYKWVRFGGDYTGEWRPFSLNEFGYAELTAPNQYGRYILAVSAYDNAGNHFGRFCDEINQEEVTHAVTQKQDEDIIHYGFVKERGEYFKPLQVLVGNNLPSVVDDYAIVGMNGETLIDALSNDYDIDGDALEILSVQDGSLGTTEISDDGKILYTPNRNARGSDSFYYTICDGNHGSACGTVYVEIYGLSVTIGDENIIDEIRIMGSEEDVVEKGLEIFVGGNKGIQVSSTSDSSIEEISWKNSNKKIIRLEENGCSADVFGKKLGDATLTITANLSNDIIATCYIDVHVIPTKVTINHVYNDEDYSTPATIVTDKKVGDELKVLKYKETINNYYTAEANPETIIVSDDRHEATINYTRKIANVKFVDWDSVLLDEQSVPYGEAATAPEDEPFREGYEFIGWSVGFSKVESDLRVVAEYAKDDHNAPTITIEGEPLFIDGTASKNSEWGYDWNITVRAVDDNDDVKSLKYAWTQSSIPPVDLSNMGDEITSGTVIKGPDVTDSGLYYLHVYAKDYFDNATQVYETFSFDRTVPDEPEISARKAGFRRYVTINYDEIDAHSGVYIVEYSLRDKITQKYGEYNEYTGEVEINTILYFTSIKVKVTDNVGNSTEYEIPESSFDYSTALMPFSAPLDVNTTMLTAVEEEVKEEIGQEDQQESTEEDIINTEEDEEVEQNIEDNNNIQEEGDANNMYNDNDLDDNDYDDSDDLNDDEDFQAEVNDDEESEGENDVDVNGEENVDAEENEDADEDVDLDTDADIDSDNENGDEDTDTDDIDFPEEEDADLEQ